MSKIRVIRSRSIAATALALTAALAMSAPAFGQANSAPKPDKAPQESAKAKPTDPLAEIGTVIPDTKLARARMRDNLYALLATAEDEKSAKKIAQRIERIWRVAGSATVALLIRRANAQLKAKKPNQAQKFLDAAVELAPDFAEGWNQRAFVQYQRGDLRGAVGDLRRALALDPNHFRALSGLATILKETGNDKAALKAYERLLEVHPYWKGAQKAYDELKRKVDGQRL